MTERTNKINEMLEKLRLTMVCCSPYVCIEEFAYDAIQEEVICYYRNSGERMRMYINVACDSDKAIINDVIRSCDQFFC